MIYFFFQAEDGIRDIGVTGVQTCALPIWPKNTVDMPPEPISRTSTNLPPRGFMDALRNPPPRLDDLPAHRAREGLQCVLESQDRKSVVVGKECRSRWSPYH